MTVVRRRARGRAGRASALLSSGVPCRFDDCRDRVRARSSPLRSSPRRRLLAGAATERAGDRADARRRLLRSASRPRRAWVAFAFEPGSRAGRLGDRPGRLRPCRRWERSPSDGAWPGRAAIDRELEAIKGQLDAIVESELRDRAAELERTLARARADSLSLLRRGGAPAGRGAASSSRARRSAARECSSPRSSRKVQAQVEQRLAAWRRDLERAQEQLGDQVERLGAAPAQLVKAAEGKLQRRRRPARGRGRGAASRARAAPRRAGAHGQGEPRARRERPSSRRTRGTAPRAARGRRAARSRERELVQRIEREEAEAAQRIQATFADVERRQVEQLERVLDRASGRFVEAAAQQFEGTAKTAREEAARRLSRELDRAVQAFAREGETLLAERLAQLGDTGAVRLEKKLAQVAAGFDRQREEFVASLGRRLGEVETELRNRLATLVAEEQAERVAIEGRLAELARRIDQTVSRARGAARLSAGRPRVRCGFGQGSLGGTNECRRRE